MILILLVCNSVSFCFFPQHSFLLSLNIKSNKSHFLLEFYFSRDFVLNSRFKLRYFFFVVSRVSWGCRIPLTASLQRCTTPPMNVLIYDSKQSDETSVMLKLWGMQNTPLVPSLPDPFWPGVVAPDRVLSMGQIELSGIQTVCKQMTNAKLNCLK